MTTRWLSRASGVYLLFVSLLSPSIAEERTEHFDRDPGWEGHNNRLAVSPRTIRQDFGYSQTSHAGGQAGEVGGIHHRRRRARLLCQEAAGQNLRRCPFRLGHAHLRRPAVARADRILQRGYSLWIKDLQCYHPPSPLARILGLNKRGEWLVNVTDLRVRMQRLVKLAEGLAKETSLWKKCNAPVLYVHRLEYIEGVENAVSGLEKARVALAKMIQDEETKSRGLG